MSVKKSFVVASVIFSLASGVSSAATIDFQFTGTVTYGGSLAAIGDQISGSFSYDTATLSTSMPPGYASYAFPTGISATVQGHTIVTNNLYVAIQDNFGGNIEDMVDVYGGPVSVDGSFLPTGLFGFRLASKPGNTGVLTSTALPSSFDVAAFDAFGFNYGQLQSDGGPSGQLLQFSVASITAVPLPSTLILLTSGLLAVGGVLRRNSLAKLSAANGGNF